MTLVARFIGGLLIVLGGIVGYGGYWLLRAIFLIPAWIAQQIGGPEIAFQALLVILGLGYILSWIIITIGLVYHGGILLLTNK